MNESGLIEQVLRIINNNYSNIYVIDINADKVYSFAFTVANSLIIKDILTYTNFIESAKIFVHPSELNNYFDALSLNKLEIESQKGNSEIKVKYRKLCETGEYRWYVNIINYLPYDGKKLIFMMSEDINERLTDIEENNLKLENEVNQYKTKIRDNSEELSDTIYEINNILSNGNKEFFQNKNTKEYINSLFARMSANNPDLQNAINYKLSNSNYYLKPTILIVDDSSIIRNSLKRIFANDYNIIMAKNGDEAIEILNNNSLNLSLNETKDNISAVLLDLVMPGCDGFAVLDYMKRYNLLTKIPVAIISGDETRETRKKVYQYDIVDMLEKPFNTEMIKRRLSKIISLYRTSNNLSNLVELQEQELNNTDNKNVEEIKLLMNHIINNVITTEQSKKLKKIVRIIALELASKFPSYELDANYVDKIINTCVYYNIGSIAMPEDFIVTISSIKKEIEYGTILVDTFIEEKLEREIALNIVKYSLESFNGMGMPNNLKGNDIPIEAQIVNLAIRLNNQAGLTTTIKQITQMDIEKYNPDLIEVLNNCKKDLKEI